MSAQYPHTLGPYHVEPGRGIVDTRGNLVAFCYSWTRYGAKREGARGQVDSIGPVTADRNAHLLAASWRLAAFARAFLDEHDGYDSIIYCDLCHAVTACMADEVSACEESDRSERASFIAQAHSFRSAHTCDPIALVDHARTCLYRLAVEALAQADETEAQ